MTPEAVLMWSAAVILAAVALAAVTASVWYAAVTVHEWRRRYRIRGLTGAQVRYIKRVSARFQARNVKES